MSSLEFGISQHDGYKTPSEDFVCHKVYENGYELFGVFDGHNSQFYSQLSSFLFPEILVNQFLSKKDPHEIVEILKCAFEEISSSLDDGPDIGGTTVSVAIVTDTHVITGSLGDSIILYLTPTGKLIYSNEIHNTDNPKECERIREAGGKILRVNDNELLLEGKLALTRSIGDKQYRTSGLITKPDISVMTRDNGYLAIMSDSFIECGVYSFLLESYIKTNSNLNDLVKYVYSFIDPTNLEESAKKIVLNQVNNFKSIITGKFYGDNTSIIYVRV